jgi:hypothetical protein
LATPKEERNDPNFHILVNASQRDRLSLDSRFLANLASQASFNGFIKFEYATRRFPSSVIVPSNSQNPPVLPDDSASNAYRVLHSHGGYYSNSESAEHGCGVVVNLATKLTCRCGALFSANVFNELFGTVAIQALKQVSPAPTVPLDKPRNTIRHDCCTAHRRCWNGPGHGMIRSVRTDASDPETILGVPGLADCLNCVGRQVRRSVVMPNDEFPIVPLHDDGRVAEHRVLDALGTLAENRNRRGWAIAIR